MKDLGDIHYFLGLQITWIDTTLTITQTRYLLSLLHKFGLVGAKPVSILITSGTSLSTTNGTFLFDPMCFRQFIRSLQYLTFTRLDISYVVHHVCQYMHAPREPRLIVVK